MAVAILEEVNNHADAEFKRLKDIGGGHTIYQNERNGSGWNTWSEIGKNQIEKKKYYLAKYGMYMCTYGIKMINNWLKIHKRIK